MSLSPWRIGAGGRSGAALAFLTVFFLPAAGWVAWAVGAYDALVEPLPPILMLSNLELSSSFISIFVLLSPVAPPFSDAFDIWIELWAIIAFVSLIAEKFALPPEKSIGASERPARVSSLAPVKPVWFILLLLLLLKSRFEPPTVILPASLLRRLVSF